MGGGGSMHPLFVEDLFTFEISKARPAPLSRVARPPTVLQSLPLHFEGFETCYGKYIQERSDKSDYKKECYKGSGSLQ